MKKDAKNPVLKVWHSLGYSARGIFIGLREDRHFKVHYIALLMVLLAAAYFQIDRLEWVAVILVAALVIGFELLNTALEKLCDLVEPNENAEIGKIKDMAAGAVLVAVVASVVTGLMVFLPRIFSF